MRNPVFAVVAHGDDWQFFMGRDMCEHIRDPQRRVVIVQTTAGDAGKPDWFWKARQNGAVQSVIRATAGASPLDAAAGTHADGFAAGYSVVFDVASVGERSILRCTVTGSGAGAAPTTIYFLHLADGHGAGWGFASTGFQSLAKLAQPGTSQPMTALWAPPGAAPAVYRSWHDLLDTLDGIVTAELGDWNRSEPVWVHATVTDDTNGGEHSDHTFTTRALDAVNERVFGGALRVVRFYTYITRSWEAAPNDAQRDVLAAYAGGCIGATTPEHGWEFIWDKEFAMWGGKEYWQDGDAIAAGPPPCCAS